MQIDPGRVLYEGRSRRPGSQIRVTDTWCVVDGSRYPIAELDLLGVTRGSRELPGVGQIAGLAALVAALLGLIVAVGSGWTRSLWPAVAVATMGTVAITFVPAAVGAVLRRPYEIWARYRGSEVRLFVTEDAEQHGQVARALLRAREQHGR